MKGERDEKHCRLQQCFLLKQSPALHLNGIQCALFSALLLGVAAEFSHSHLFCIVAMILKRIYIYDCFPLLLVWVIMGFAFRHKEDVLTPARK